MGNDKLNKEILSTSLKNSKITCSFLVPLRVYKKLPRDSQKKIGKNLKILLQKHRARILKSKRIHNRTSTSLYQRKGNDLIKFNVRISESDWEQLTVLSRSHGVSNCYLYYILLNWEYLSAENIMISSYKYNFDKKQNIALIWFLDLNFSFSRRQILLTKRFPLEGIG
ncbi:DUF1564 family protein [Leptospira sp. WS92.C1]